MLPVERFPPGSVPAATVFNRQAGFYLIG